MSLYINTQDLNNFKKNIKIYIETKSGEGIGITTALESGFDTIYSIDSDESNYQNCRSKFSENTNVNLILGNFSEELPKIISQIKDPIVLFFEYRSFLNEDSSELSADNFSNQLNSIESLPEEILKKSVIMINGMSDYVAIDDKLVAKIEESLKKIRPNGEIYYYSCPDYGYISSILVSYELD